MIIAKKGWEALTPTSQPLERRGIAPDRVSACRCVVMQARSTDGCLLLLPTGRKKATQNTEPHDSLSVVQPTTAEICIIEPASVAGLAVSPCRCCLRLPILASLLSKLHTDSDALCTPFGRGFCSLKPQNFPALLWPPRLSHDRSMQPAIR
jgi:hypothetical protein